MKQGHPPEAIFHSNWRTTLGILKPYWVSERKWQGYRLLAAVVILTFSMVYMTVVINNWSREMYDALQNKHAPLFYSLMVRFTYLAVIYILIAIARAYLRQSLTIEWRTWLTENYLSRWLSNRAYFQIQQQQYADNPDQRIAQDLSSISTGTLSLFLGLLSSVQTLISFSIILWGIGGTLTFTFSGQAYEIHGYLIYVCMLYAVFGTGLTWIVGRRLVPQNYLQERYEADFRFGMIRIREYAESIALYLGEKRERQSLRERFGRIRENYYKIMSTTLRLNTATTFYDQFAIIFPLLVLAPRYFSGAVTLGGMMQANGAFGRVQSALSWFVETFDTLVDWKASLNRLAGFDAAIRNAEKLQSRGLLALQVNYAPENSDIHLDQCSIADPAGRILTSPLTLTARKGENILISGPSGCGKSTLLRVLSGIWPYGQGSITLPSRESMMFLPQKSYLPIGTLRDALMYPGEQTFPDSQLCPYLEQCNLHALTRELETSDNWAQRLSPGEQQRLAMVRALIARPAWLVLDEATSALDPHSEQIMYTLLSRELPDTTLISIAHRESLSAYHQVSWRFASPASAATEAVDLTTGTTVMNVTASPIESVK